MADKEKPTAKPAQPLSEDDTAKVVGGVMPGGGAGGAGGIGGRVLSDPCKDSADTGILGCPG